MFVTNLRRGLGFVILLAALIAFIWGFWPARRVTRTVELPGIDFQSTEERPEEVSSPGKLSLAWPGWLQVGSTARIQARLVRLDPLGQEGANQAGAAGSATRLSHPEAAWAIEARLEIPGMLSEPAGTVSEALTPSSPLEFTWEVLPLQKGAYPGSIWLHAVRLPGDETSPAERRLLSVQPVEIRATTLLGVNAYLAQVIGIVGVVVGTALVIDLLFQRFHRTVPR